MGHRSKRTQARPVIWALAAALLCCSLGLGARPAQAATMEELQAKVDEAGLAYDEASARVSELEAQIDESQAQIDEINAALPAQQEDAETSIRSLYKMQQGTPGLVTLLLSSESFTDFISTYQYLNALQQANAEELDELVAMQEALVSAQDTLEASKKEADAKQQEAEAAMAEAQQAVDELNAQLIAEAQAEAARLEAELKAQQEQLAAEAAAAAEAEAAQSAEEGQDGTSSTETSAGTTTTSSATSSNPDATDGTEVNADGQWMVGLASAYSMADNTGWDATASGEKLTDDSVTVAVPASQSYLLGRSVEIRWNGITITARVTDTGGFAKYGRVLDLAGGCWKAFGFSSPNDWGVRAVAYRFL